MRFRSSISEYYIKSFIHTSNCTAMKWQWGIKVLTVIYNSSFISQMQQLIIHNLVLWFGAFLYYSVRQPDWGGFAEVASSRNFHLRLDFLLWFVPGVAAFVFPQKVYSFQVVSYYKKNYAGNFSCFILVEILDVIWSLYIEHHRSIFTCR